MANHNWQIQTIDGGYLGDGDFWHCPDCGAAGGPVLSQWEIDHFTNKGLKLWNENRRWNAFIPGAGASQKVSEDCEQAQQEIKAYLQERINKMQTTWAKAQAKLLDDVLQISKATNLLPLLKVIQEIERSSKCMSIGEVKDLLKTVGLIGE